MTDLVQRLRDARDLKTDERVRESLCGEAAAEIERLREALLKASDTLRDVGRTMRILQRPLIAEACELAEFASRVVLEPKP